MKPQTHTPVLIVIVLLFISAIAYCCSNNPPVADLEAVPVYVHLGNSVTLDGSGSYDTDGSIVEYKWDWTNDGYDCTTPYEEITHVYESVGTYTAKLQVKDDDGGSDTDTCTVYVVDVDILYVDKDATGLNNGTSWDNAYKYLQDALDVAQDGHQIWVAAETYFPFEDSYGNHTMYDYETFQMVEGVEIYGGFSGDEISLDDRNLKVNKTVLGGYGSSFIVVKGASNALIDGFYIIGGNADLTPLDKGGGMCNISDSNLVVKNCVFVSNKAINGGAVYNENCYPTFLNCVFINNQASSNGGAVYNISTNPNFINCTFTENKAGSYGGAMYNDNSDPNIKNAIIWNNTANVGPSIYNTNDSVPLISYSDIEGCYGGPDPCDPWDTSYGADMNDNNDVDPRFNVHDLGYTCLLWCELDDSDSNATDSSDNGYDGTLKGDASWTTGKIGGALSLDGNGDYVEFHDFKGITGTASRTTTAWIKTNNEEGMILTWGDGTVPGKAWNMWINAGFLRAQVYGGWIRGTTYIVDGQWHHVAVVLEDDGSPIIDEVRLYVDGNLETLNYTGNGRAINTGSAQNVIIGTWLADPVYFDGKIDDVRIYDRVLSDEEIGDLYEYGLLEGKEYHLDVDSPCINNGDPLTNVIKDPNYPRPIANTDVEGHPRIWWGLIDKGADEYCVIDVPYITSFETYQDYKLGYFYSNPTEEMAKWTTSGVPYITTKYYYYEEAKYYTYYVAELYSNSSISRSFWNKGEDCNHFRVNCIPAENSYINIMNDSNTVASIKFADDGKIYVLNEGTDYDTGVNYESIAGQCRDFFTDYPRDYNHYSYENCWIEFEIQINWDSNTYDVYWSYWDNILEEYVVMDLVKDGIKFDQDYSKFTDLSFETGDVYFTDRFLINRISISGESDEGGVYGEDQDVCILYPTPKWSNIIRGRRPLYGKVWFDKLGEYKIKCCPSDLDSSEPNNWMIVDSHYNVKDIYKRLGFWQATMFCNGDYFLGIEVYDDLHRLYTSGCGVITKDVYANDIEKEIQAEFPVIGRLKPQCYRYQDKIPGITVNWPGTFPFEFRRIYNSGMRTRLYPMFFGWEHNNDIKIIENTGSFWETDVNELPLADSEGMGIGQLWLQQADSYRIFKGRVDPCDNSRVIYKPLDNENDYIIRKSVVTSPNTNAVFDLSYTYYSTVGLTMEFDSEDNELGRALPAGEGAVFWTVCKGIDKKEDRFGNALEYTWNEDQSKLLEISNNRTPAKLVFTYEGLYSYDLLSRVQLYDDDAPTQTEVTFDWGRYFFDDVRNHYVMGYYMSYGDEFVDISEIVAEHWMDDEYIMIGMAPTPGPSGAGIPHIETALRYDKDKSLIDKLEDVMHTGLSDSAQYEMLQVYNYDYDNQGNLITTTGVRANRIASDSSPGTQLWWENHEMVLDLLREKIAVTSPEGALLEQKTKIFSVNFDPCDYDKSLWYCMGYNLHQPGGGGAVDTEYCYKNEDFPHKPTVIIEQFDDDGDGTYDRDSRKTTMEYDDRGNLAEQRVYIDANNYVLTQYEYHNNYDFPISKTTYQGYCHDEDEAIITSGGKVEQQWLYGNAGGSLVNGGAGGDYLIQEKTLLDDSGTPVWAETSYEYYSGGQLERKTDPEGAMTYYQYDDNGFLSDEWHGAPAGIPQSDPQKRYYYDALGLKILEADYLGLVKMNVLDFRGRVKEVRHYIDVNAVSRPNFVPDFYDDDIEYETSYDWWSNRTEYEYEDATSKPWVTTLPRAGQIIDIHVIGLDGEPLWERNFMFEYCGRHRYFRSTDGRILYEQVDQLPSGDLIDINYIYDSMFRLMHKYSYEKKNNFYLSYYEHIKHEEYRYDASGNKTYEAVYSVDGYSIDEYPYGAYKRTLQKENRFYYDQLDRLIKKVQDPCDVNQVVEYGYDALGNRIYVIDPAGNVIFTDYDQANRKIREYFAAEPVYNPSTSDVSIVATKANAVVKKEVEYYKDNKVKDVNSYDYDDSVLSYTEFTYDNRGRIDTVTEQIDASNNAVTKYYYSDEGFEYGPYSPDLNDPNHYNYYHIRITDAEDQETYISFAPCGKIQKVLYPTGKCELIHYDEYEDPYKVTVWNADNEIRHILYEYDDYGKVSKIQHPNELEPYGYYTEFEYTERFFGKFGKVRQITDYRRDSDRPGTPGSTFTFDYWYLSENIRSFEDYEGYTVDYNYSDAYSQPTMIHVSDSDGDVIYNVKYTYDLLGRLTDVNDPCVTGHDIASFAYDDNGNRSQLKYWLDGEFGGTNFYLDYGYDIDNYLSYISATGGPVYDFDATYAGGIDGLGRLKSGAETIEFPGYSDRTHTLSYDYDMRSQLTEAIIGNINSSLWTANYYYYLDGNIEEKVVNNSPTDYQYDTTAGGGNFDSDEMTKAGNTSLDWDKNGNLVDGLSSISFEWNWENKLRKATIGSDTIELKYDPMGNRVWKKSVVNSNTTKRKYIIDISGKLPTILCEIDPDTSSLKRSYAY
ncbi:MAG: PKD domain-containing protein, partial [Sedimentisphaerales bacterium]|nr:PKD domain-containing protein [Sedimentisphaerales bacterium]